MNTVSQRKLYPRILALVLLLLAACLAAPGALAAEHELGVAMSFFSPADERTEQTFDIDSGPIPSLFYRYQSESHAFLISAGFESWSRVEREGAGRIETELEFVPIVGSYRYLPRHDESFSFFIGGGLGVLVYDASATGSGGSLSFLASETGAVASIDVDMGGFYASLGVSVALTRP